MVYQDTSLPSSPIMGYKGKSITDAGHFYAPYVPLYTTPSMDVGLLTSLKWGYKFNPQPKLFIEETNNHIEACVINGIFSTSIRDGEDGKEMVLGDPQIENSNVVFLASLTLLEPTDSGSWSFIRTLTIATNGSSYWTQSGQWLKGRKELILNSSDRNMISEAIEKYIRDNYDAEPEHT